jgi:hypothetical protein
MSDKNHKVAEKRWMQGPGDARRTPFFGAFLSDARMETAEPICQVAKSAPTSSVAHGGTIINNPADLSPSHNFI